MTDDNHQIIDGSHNKQININKPSGPVNITDASITTIRYQPTKEKRFSSTIKLFINDIIKNIIPLFIAGIASLLAKFDYQTEWFLANKNDPWVLISSIFHDQSHVFIFLFDVTILLLLFIFLPLVLISLTKMGFLLLKKPFFWNKYFYIKEDDGSILRAKYVGKCPIPSCSGKAWVKKPFPNEEKINVAGMCDKSRTHTYNFDCTTLSGDRCHLTPKKEVKHIHKHETNNYYQ